MGGILRSEVRLKTIQVELPVALVEPAQLESPPRDAAKLLALELIREEKVWRDA